MEERTEAKPEPTPTLLIEMAPGRWGRKFHIAVGEKKLSLSEVDAVRIAKDILRQSKPRGAFLWGDMKPRKEANHE